MEWLGICVYLYSFLPSSQIKSIRLKNEVYCYHPHFIFKATLYFNVLQLWILILFHFVIMNFVLSCISSNLSCISSLVQLAFYEQLKFYTTSIYIILSKILFKTHFLHKLFMQAQVQPCKFLDIWNMCSWTYTLPM